MAIELTSLTDINNLPFDQIIDVRSPAEYALDHIPGAINLPVLSDEERARVGTIYVQESRFRARKLGAALVARNAAAHLEGALSDKDGSYRPLVYCWRGGQRSGSFAGILAQIGWRVDVLAGGYRSYRRLVAECLYETEFPAPVVVLGGNTGTAKTEILHRVAAQGGQIIDLEGLANHRGSLFGARAGGQPSQKAFEGALAQIISTLDPMRPVLIEAESSKVGDIFVPPSLWKAMRAAPRLTLEVPLDERARYLTRAYADLIADTDNLGAIINKLRHLHAVSQIDNWLDLAAENSFEALAKGLMEQHYDPRYSKQNDPETDPANAALLVSDLSETGLDLTAAQVMDLVNAI